MSVQSDQQFVAWVRTKYPALFSRVAGPLGESQASGGWLSNLVAQINNVAPSILQTVQQVREVNANYRRAKEGLPPIDFEPYETLPPPQPAPGMVTTGYAAPSKNVWPVVLLGGAVLVMVFLGMRR